MILIIYSEFLARIFTVLSSQLVLAVGFCGILFFALESWGYAEEHSADTWPMVTCFGIGSSLLVILAFSASTRKRFPHNYAIMTLFTMSEGALLAVMSSQYQTIMPIKTLIFVALSIMTLALIAYQSKLDLTTMNAVALVIIQMVILSALLFLMWPNSFLIVTYSAIAATIYVIVSLSVPYS